MNQTTSASASIANPCQVACIRRYHRHLSRRVPVTVEEAGRRWIARYAALWRRRFSLLACGRRATCPGLPAAGGMEE